MSTTDPQTAATETTPVLPADLPVPDPGLSLAAGAGPDSGTGSQDRPGPAPETGQPAGYEPAAGPGSHAAPPRVSLRELEARIAVPLQVASEPVWDDLMARAASDQQPWAEVVDRLIAQGAAEMYERQYRVWYGKSPAEAA